MTFGSDVLAVAVTFGCYAIAATGGSGAGVSDAIAAVVG